MRATLKRERRLPERLIMQIVNTNKGSVVVHTFHMQVLLSNNGHKKLKKRINLINLVNRDPEKTT